MLSDGAKPKDDAAKRAKDEKARSAIILSTTLMQIGHIKNSTTAKDAWNTLSEIHRPKGLVQKVTLFKQLLNMRYNVKL